MQSGDVMTNEYFQCINNSVLRFFLSTYSVYANVLMILLVIQGELLI